MENAQYLQAFLDESEDNLQLLNDLCLQLERGEGGDQTYAVMFRAAHTLKGMSASMGFQSMATVTHRLEDLLGALRDAPDRADSACLDGLFAGLDCLAAMLAQIRAQGSDDVAEATAVVAQLNGLCTRISGAAQVAAAAVAGASGAATVAGTTLNAAGADARSAVEQALAAGMPAGWLTVTLSSDCQLKGARAVLLARALEDVGVCLASVPSAEQMQAGEISGSLAFLLVLSTTPEAAVAAALNVSEVERAQWLPWTEAERADNGATAPAAGLPAATATSATGQAVPSASAAAPAGGRPAAAVRAAGEGGPRSGDRTLRVPVERLDTLMNLLSELVIEKTRLQVYAQQAQAPVLQEVSDRLGRVTGDLQAAVMSLRMVPIEMLFQRFPRLVRDLSKTLGKDIRLDMSGLETEFDRTIIDEMGEALVHLIRNSADHGLESADQRRAAGKPETGVIALRAYTSGQYVYIEVADDGQGIHVEKVRQRAVERGLTTAAAAAELADEEVYEFLFRSGFSTADQVSDISGRGVGLDAVRQKVESLGGRIHIASAAGQGTTFRIQLPLTLSILQALLVEAGGYLLALPIGSIEEVVFARPHDLRTVHGRTVLDYRGHLVPLVDTGAWLESDSSLQQTPWRVVICRDGARRMAFAVNQLLGQREIVHKSLGEYLRGVRWFAGATLLGDGRIALIADVHHWLSLAGRSN